MTDALSRLKTALSSRYAIERELGSGGMATVYLAQDLKHDREVALKVMRPELSAILGGERFLREIRIAANLNHPHILPLPDSGEADGFLYYVMPHVEGETLRSKVEREKQLSIDEAVALTRQVAWALDYAHQQGVIHRDIKPENILIEEGHAVVADFGVARAVSAAGGAQLTETGIAVGTPVYMSPEQASGERELDGRSDIYALGCVLYEMLAGEPPFTGPTAESIAHQHLSAEPPSVTAVRPTVPDDVANTLGKALAKAPADRFDTAAQLVDALNAALLATSAPTVTVRRQVPIALLAVLAVLAAVVGTRLPRGRAVAIDPELIAVLPFENQTGADSLETFGVIAADMISNSLARTGLVSVVPTAKAVAAGRRRSAINPVVLGFLAEATGAGLLVSGSFFFRGESLAVQAQIADVGRDWRLESLDLVVIPLDLVVVPETDQPAAMEQVLQMVSVALASRTDPRLSAVAPLADLPMSVEAYREYAEGMELTAYAHWAVALEHFRRALLLDSTSAQVLLMTALAEWQATGNVAKTDSLLSVVEIHKSQLPPYHLAQFDSLLGWVRGDREGALRGLMEPKG
jgi:serine/threonine-protein kinase